MPPHGLGGSRQTSADDIAWDQARPSSPPTGSGTSPASSSPAACKLPGSDGAADAAGGPGCVVRPWLGATNEFGRGSRRPRALACATPRAALPLLGAHVVVEDGVGVAVAVLLPPVLERPARRHKPPLVVAPPQPGTGEAPGIHLARHLALDDDKVEVVAGRSGPRHSSRAPPIDRLVRQTAPRSAQSETAESPPPQHAASSVGMLTQRLRFRPRKARPTAPPGCHPIQTPSRCRQWCGTRCWGPYSGTRPADGSRDQGGCRPQRLEAGPVGRSRKRNIPFVVIDCVVLATTVRQGWRGLKRWTACKGSWRARRPTHGCCSVTRPHPDATRTSRTCAGMAQPTESLDRTPTGTAR